MNWILSLTLLFVLAGCEFKAESGTSSMQTFQGAGITFEVPLESNSVSHGPHGIMYQGDSVSAQTDGAILVVDGKGYGRLAAGDVVNVQNPPGVLVNGIERNPDT